MKNENKITKKESKQLLNIAMKYIYAMQTVWSCLCPYDEL